MAAVEDYLAMGGYAAFVWPAFAVTAVIMAGLAIQSLSAYRRRQRELTRLERGDEP
jgi:heme exporter protein D